MTSVSGSWRFFLFDKVQVLLYDGEERFFIEGLYGECG